MKNHTKEIGFVFLASFLIAIVCVFLIRENRKEDISFTCSSELTISYPGEEHVYATYNGYIYKNGNGLATFRGTTVKGGKGYILNIDVPFKLEGDEVKKITYGKTIKKNNDTTPDDITFRKMLKEGSTYYFTFYRSPAGDVVIKERGSVAYVCSH